MDKRRLFYPECRFGGFTDVDATLRFYHRVKSLVTPHSIVLDIGCGRGSRLAVATPFVRSVIDYKGFAKMVIGIDVDPVGQTNPSLDEFRLMAGNSWPVESASIDVAYCDQVIEHIEDPEAFFNEVDRVLKPGGHICIRTPNAWGYVAIAAKLIPSSLHKRVLGVAQDGRFLHDIFPTFYRCNTRRAIRRATARRGYDCLAYTVEAEPAYFNFSLIAYAVMHYVHRIMPPLFRNTLLAFARKPDGAGSSPAT